MRNIPFPVHILATAALIYNDKNQVLLVKNPRRDWEFPGGQVEEGEDLFEGVIREVKEETGVDVSIDRLVGLYSNIKGYYLDDGKSYVPSKLMIDFVGKSINDSNLSISEEHIDIGWFSVNEAQKLIQSPSYVERFKNMLEVDGQVAIQAYDRDKKNKKLNIHMNQKIDV